MVTGGSDHGTTVFGGVDIVAHYAVLVSIKVANGRFTIGDYVSFIAVPVDTGEDYIRLSVVSIIAYEGVRHETSRPVLGVGPVVVDITIPVVQFAGVEGEGVRTEEALCQYTGFTVTDIVLSLGLHGGEIGTAVAGSGAFGLLEHSVETIGGDGRRSALEGFERIAVRVEGIGGHRHEEASILTITAAEGDSTLTNLIIGGGHAHILVGRCINFTPNLIARGLLRAGYTCCFELSAEIHRLEGAPSVVVSRRLRHFVALLQRIVVVLFGELAGQCRQRGDVQFVNRQIGHAINCQPAVYLDISVVTAQCFLECSGITSLINRPVVAFKAIVSRYKNIVVQQVFGQIKDLNFTII